MYHPRTEHTCQVIRHLIQVNESRPLSDKSSHDLFTRVRGEVEYWKAVSDRLRKENIPKRWNEFKIWKKENPHATHEEILAMFELLDSGRSRKEWKR